MWDGDICSGAIDTGRSLLVAARSAPKIHHDAVLIRDEGRVAPEEGEEVIVVTRIAFGYRKSEITGKFNNLNPREARQKFYAMTGLGPIPNEDNQRTSDVRFMGIVKERASGQTISIGNAFEITGRFRVRDRNLLQKALDCGVGARKSYGFGLLVIRKGG
jgi:hypothetical protein